MEISKPVKASLTEQTHIVFSGHTNGMGRLFGGQLVEWMDVVAGVVARRHASCEVTTVSIDKVDFSAPANINDLVVIVGKIIYVGNSSMNVLVSAYVEKLSGKRKLINSATFTMVALDKNDKPCRVPRLTLLTDEEKALFEKVEMKRKKLIC